jgi:hypothetical protein
MLAPRVWDEYGKPVPVSKLSDVELEQYRNAARQTVARYWEKQSALVFAPPVVGYLILFGVLPWIGRGFRSTHL